MPDHPTYRRQVLDHLGLIAGMCDALSIGDVLAQATHQHPAMRDLTVGEAIKAMVRNGLGCINQALSLVPRFFHNTPTSQRISPRVTPAQRNDDALGRAVDTLDASGVTALYSLIAATAAQRLGLAPTFAPLDSPSLHVDGRYTCDEEPAEQVMHIPRGDSRDHRPALHQGRLDVIIEHQAGMPVWMQPRSGNRRDAQDLGQIVSKHLRQRHTTSGRTCLVAARALSSAEHLQTLAETPMQWITRVPATVSEAHAALAQANPQTMAPLREGYRSQALPSTSGQVEQRWVRIYSAPRQAPGQRTVDKQLLQQSDQDLKACKKLCGTPCAWEAEARQALATWERG